MSEMGYPDDEIRRVTIDINQAGNYFNNGDYEPFIKNLEDVVGELVGLINKTREDLK